MAWACHFLSRSRRISGALKRSWSPWRKNRTRRWPPQSPRTRSQTGRFVVSQSWRARETPRVSCFSKSLSHPPGFGQRQREWSEGGLAIAPIIQRTTARGQQLACISVCAWPTVNRGAFSCSVCVSGWVNTNARVHFSGNAAARGSESDIAEVDCLAEGGERVAGGDEFVGDEAAKVGGGDAAHHAVPLNFLGGVKFVTAGNAAGVEVADPIDVFLNGAD